MLSRLTLRFQQFMTTNSHKSPKFKRRLRNTLIISIVGFSALYGYRRYDRSRWLNEICDSERNSGTKPRIVVLGSGKICFSIHFN